MIRVFCNLEYELLKICENKSNCVSPSVEVYDFQRRMQNF